MTKVRVTLPWRKVAGRKVFFIALGRPKAACGSFPTRDDKGEGDASMGIWRLVERTAGPHSTSLRAGSSLRGAPVPRHVGTSGMTVHVWLRDAGAKKIVIPIKSHKLRAKPDFAPRGADKTTCAPFRKERRMKVCQSNQVAQEIRGRRGICSSFSPACKL
jgi:hypothetical protein